MFLSGMAGPGKSEVIKAFIYFVETLSKQLGWHFDEDTIKITAMTGSATCELHHATTTHSAAALIRISHQQKIFRNGVAQK